MVRVDRRVKTDVRIRLESERRIIMKALKQFVMTNCSVKEQMEAIGIYYKFKQ
jgi:hypothetical protein